MEQIIRQILDIENRAQQIVQEAGENKEQFAVKIAEEKNKLIAQIRQKTDKEKDAIEKHIQAGTEFQILQIQQKAEQTTAAMDEAFSKSGDAWAEKIFRQVIKQL